jgi:hypothetical protein
VPEHVREAASRPGELAADDRPEGGSGTPCHWKVSICDGHVRFVEERSELGFEHTCWSVSRASEPSTKDERLTYVAVQGSVETTGNNDSPEGLLKPERIHAQGNA